MNDADFKRLDLSKFHTLTNRARSKLLQAMTPQQQQKAVAAVGAAYVAGTGAAKSKPAPAQAFTAERAAQVYAKRRESVVGHVTAKQTNAGGPAFGSEEHADAVYAKREQASGGRHANIQRG